MAEQNLKSETLQVYREMLSALLDNELAASELEILLQALETYPELRKDWLSFQNIHAGMHRESVHVHSDTLAFADGVSEALGDIQFTKAPVFALLPEAQKKKTEALPPFRAFAVAASVMCVVAFTWFANENRHALKQLAFGESTKIEAISTDEPLIDRQIQTRQNQQAYRVLVSSGASEVSSKVAGKDSDIYLSNKRIEDYMLFHAENASLNNNKGMMPFARMSRLATENQF